MGLGFGLLGVNGLRVVKVEGLRGNLTLRFFFMTFKCSGVVYRVSGGVLIGFCDRKDVLGILNDDWNGFI